MNMREKSEYNKIMANVVKALNHPERYTGGMSGTLSAICDDIDRAIHIRKTA